MERTIKTGCSRLLNVLARAPRACWIALNPEETEIVGQGRTIAEALTNARKAGVDDALVLWSPEQA